VSAKYDLLYSSNSTKKAAKQGRSVLVVRETKEHLFRHRRKLNREQRELRKAVERETGKNGRRGELPHLAGYPEGEGNRVLPYSC